MDKCYYVLLLIFLPLFEIGLLYVTNAHRFIIRAMKQYFDLDQHERKFIKYGFYQEIQILSVATIADYVLTVFVDFLTNAIVPSTLMALAVLVVVITTFPNSFRNKHERVNMRRLHGVIIQLYMLVAVFFSTLFALVFDTAFITFLPVPPGSYLNLQTADGLSIPIWFTLSRFLVYILPTTVYIGVLFYLAHFCFLLWSRAFYYGFLKRFWWAIKDDKIVLDFGDPDLDLG